MGVYVVTGGTRGIGASAADILEQKGHTVVRSASKKSDLDADLGTKEGRAQLIDGVHRLFPEGIDGLISNAGIASTRPISRVISVNYFGAVAVMQGLFDLLQKKNGRVCCVTSASLAYDMRDGDKSKFYVDNLLVNCEDEERIGKLVDTFDPVEVDNAIYGSTKIALARWIKRTAPGWAVKGVRLNGLAPGATATSIMDGVEDMGEDLDVIFAFPIPMYYGRKHFLVPEEVGKAVAYMVSEDIGGICGETLYCDGGCAAVLHADKYF